MPGPDLRSRGARVLSLFACAAISTLAAMSVHAQDVIRFGAPLPLTGALAP